MLGAIGLDERQETAYRALVAAGAAELTDLALRLALPEAEAERVLRRLEQQGLAAQSSARPGRWVAAPPGVALGALLIQQRHELERAELASALLAEEYRAEASAPAVHDLVEVVTGAGAVAQRFHQLQLGAVSEVCALVTGRPVAVTGMENESEVHPGLQPEAGGRRLVDRDDPGAVRQPQGAPVGAAAGRSRHLLDPGDRLGGQQVELGGGGVRSPVGEPQRDTGAQPLTAGAAEPRARFGAQGAGGAGVDLPDGVVELADAGETGREKRCRSPAARWSGGAPGRCGSAGRGRARRARRPAQR
ncbi:hypothetical protein SCALM49S_01315 [Streptomyces californicus]